MSGVSPASFPTQFCRHHNYIGLCMPLENDGLCHNINADEWDGIQSVYNPKGDKVELYPAYNCGAVTNADGTPGEPIPATLISGNVCELGALDDNVHSYKVLSPPAPAC
eukprot:TRINITY_DN75341_c0_g1_i1.p2 TRINITY_DN75341_c0_g1~~TRINITY_DN75341_c0_g1_i1.p2  ORF type:complete len:116 (+),score=10.90 TRINITY_DN75341_c0_g1_i1:23-349(+)